MAIYITGDIHGTLEIDRLSPDSLAEMDIDPSADDYLIILGDVAAVFYTKPWEMPDLNQMDQQVVDALEEAPWTVLFIDGNHDNTDALADADEEEWNGGLVHRISDRVIHLMRGQIYDIDGATLFTMGGAESIDIASRTEGVSWWASELPSYDEMEEGLANLEEHGNEVNVILTHTAPSSMLDELVYGEIYPDELTDYLQQIYENTKFDEWYFGHFHDDATCSDSRLTCVYNEIIELEPTP